MANKARDAIADSFGLTGMKREEIADTLVNPFWPPLRLISAYRGFHLRGAFLLVCPIFCGLSLLPLGTKGHIPYMEQRPLITHNGKYHRMIWTIYLLGFPYNIWMSGVLKKKNEYNLLPIKAANGIIMHDLSS